MRVDRKAFELGVSDVLTLAPLRRIFKALWRALRYKPN